MATWFYCAQITHVCTSLDGCHNQTFLVDGIMPKVINDVPLDNVNIDSAEEVINYIKESHRQKTEMGNSLGSVVLTAFNRV